MPENLLDELATALSRNRGGGCGIPSLAFGSSLLGTTTWSFRRWVAQFVATALPSMPLLSTSQSPIPYARYPRGDNFRKVKSPFRA
jgi:hypothetical protein